VALLRNKSARGVLTGLGSTMFILKFTLITLKAIDIYLKRSALLYFIGELIDVLGR